MGRKESNQTNKQNFSKYLLSSLDFEFYEIRKILI